jgi:four helix bundle protein
MELFSDALGLSLSLGLSLGFRRGEMKKLSHESLSVYQRSVGFVAWSSDLCRSKCEIVGEIQNQFKRAFISIPLNIAEGAGKQSGRDQARFYDNARGSALECAACLDVLVAMQLVLPQEIESGKEQVAVIVAMLTSLARSVAGERVNDLSFSYSP